MLVSNQPRSYDYFRSLTANVLFVLWLVIPRVSSGIFVHLLLNSNSNSAKFPNNIIIITISFKTKFRICHEQLGEPETLDEKRERNLNPIHPCQCSLVAHVSVRPQSYILLPSLRVSILMMIY